MPPAATLTLAQKLLERIEASIVERGLVALRLARSAGQLARRNPSLPI